MFFVKGSLTFSVCFISLAHKLNKYINLVPHADDVVYINSLIIYLHCFLIFRYFEEGTVEELKVRIGVESIVLDGWGSRAVYGALAAALSAGLVALAPHSPPLRAALGLNEPPPTPGHAQAKLNKLQRNLQNAAACKARTVARNKSRDKRSAALAL